MESKNKLKQIDIKTCACYYYDDTINGTNINFNNILLNKKVYESISVYDIFYKTSVGPKQLCIRFDKIDGFMMVFDGKIKHLVLFHYGSFEKVCNKIKCLINKKAVLQIVLIIILEGPELIHIILYLFNTFQNVIILIKSVVNKNKSNCYDMFLEKSSYKDKSDA